MYLYYSINRGKQVIRLLGFFGKIKKLPSIKSSSFL
nr:MAG TPA: hypothetical protein [Caudoviricetes sp.]